MQMKRICHVEFESCFVGRGYLKFVIENSAKLCVYSVVNGISCRLTQT